MPKYKLEIPYLELWYCTAIVEADSAEDAVQKYNESLTGSPRTDDPDGSEFVETLGVAEDQPFYAQEVEEHTTYEPIGESVRIDL
jgi:hypothetical protein